MSILQYKPMRILIITENGSKFKEFANSTKTNMQHFYCLIIATLEPSKME